jgi:DNA polymerase (family 10)
VGLADIPPELREGSGEIEAAAAGPLPDLLERKDLQGLIHCHSNYSDGSTSIEELAVACRDAGYRYLGVTDHSATAAYAGGLSPEDLARQGEEIDRLNEHLPGVRILKGVEADILADGRLDYDEATLGRLDFVIGSVHSRFSMGVKQMTSRIVAAMENPYLSIVGHPTGRLLLTRDPYPLDVEAVLSRAAETGVAIEINADPHRLDLDWRYLRHAAELGVAISIGADAHSVAGMSNVDVGVGIARKGWLQRQHILNAQPLQAFLEHARRRRSG